MPSWKGIIGRGFRPQEFKDYVGTLSFSDWRPQFVVVHNTSAPRLSQWHSVSGETRMRNLEDYYKNNQKWSAGPHLFVADDLIWVFTPLTTSGVHSPSWNAISWGVEMVGEYEEEPFNPGVRENTVDALAVLHSWRGLSPDSLHFHKEDPKTTHKECPGRNVDKADLIARIQARMESANEGEHQPQDNYLEIGAGLPQGVTSPTPVAGPPLGKARVQSPDGTLNVRSAPKASAQKLRQLQTGDAVEVYEISGKWCRIAAQGSEWVAREYLVAEETTTPAANEVILPSPTVDHQVKQIDTLYEVFYSDEAKKTLRRDVPLFQLTDRGGCFHRGSMQIDVDGSPRAYFPGNASPLRLDDLSSADSQGGSSTYIQGKQYGSITALGPRPGFYVSATSLRLSQQRMWDCNNFVDAENVPYFVHPPGRNGVNLGDVGIIVHVPTMEWTAAIFGDTNDNRRVSEASLRVAVNLGRSKIDPKTLKVKGLSASNGDDARNYFYLYFPGSAPGPAATAPHWPEKAIEAQAEPLFAAWGGIDMVKECLSHI